MIKVTVGNNVRRNSVIVDEQTTLRSVLEENDIDYKRVTMQQNSSTLQPG